MNSVGESTDKPEKARPSRIWEWTQMTKKVDRGALSPTARHAMHALALFADPDGGNCFPTYETLGETMGLSRAQAGAAIKELADKGWIERRRIMVAGKPRTLFVPLVPTAALSGTPDAPPSGTPDAPPSGTPDATCTSDLTKGKTSDAAASDGVPLDDVDAFDLEYAEVVAALDGLSHDEGWQALDMLDRREPVPKVVNTIRKRRHGRTLRAVS